MVGMAQLLIESAYIWCDGTITGDAYAFNWAEVAGRRTYWMKRRISGMMAHLLVMLTHFTGRTALSRCGSAHILDEAAHIWYDGAFTGDVDAFYWANGAIIMQNSAMIHQNNAIISSSGA
ncbi:hypothetical protein [Cytobacillus oceanisediminis]|uniref:hypothetical protein n=1 Tax=Cytobacillus oceanisediminis TaxID=665099 RepID=UPI0020795EE7|nr:hypothetical protein [Cytobacillus oceanisediminis]USK45234.1 hypothetical protein LIT27_05010 [Cytobacillus oceanisediminis]